MPIEASFANADPLSDEKVLGGIRRGRLKQVSGAQEKRSMLSQNRGSSPLDLVEEWWLQAN
jgi:hypothetical protein